MNTKQAFIEAIESDKYNWELRQIFTDWLKENGTFPEDNELLLFHLNWTKEWQQSYDWLTKFADGIGSSLSEMKEAVDQYLETGIGLQVGRDYLGFWATNSLVTEEELGEFWGHWEQWSKCKVGEDRKRDCPFECCT